VKRCREAGPGSRWLLRPAPAKIHSLGISELDVYNAVSKSNINIGGDVIVDNSQAYVVRGIGLLNDINEIKNIIIENINGFPVLIKDVADVEISNQPRLGQVGRSDDIILNGKRTIKDSTDVVEAIVLMRKGENAAQVIRALRNKIDFINRKVLPPDTQIVPYYNREDLISCITWWKVFCLSLFWYPSSCSTGGPH